MAAPTTAGDTYANMNGLVKQKYATKIQNLVPDVARLYKEIEFSKATTVGDYYNQPVIVQNETGFTYAAGQNNSIIGYNLANPMVMQNALVAPTQLYLKSRISYEIVKRAVQQGETAFEAAVMLLIKNMVDSMALRLEMSLLYGGSGLATINAATAPVQVGSSAVYTQTLTITTAAWAVGLWQGQESSYLDFFHAGDTLASQAINVTTVPTATAPQLVTVVPSAKQLNIQGTTTDLTALKTYVDANPDAATVWWGGSFGTEMVGLKTIITNTGTLFNVNAAVYDLWRGNTFDNGNVALSQASIQQAVAEAAGRGLMDEDLLLVVSNGGWADLMTSQAALRMYDTSYSANKLENGAKELAFNSQNGKIRVMAHAMCKDGDAFLLPMKQLSRIGACEPTFDLPGQESSDPFTPLADYAGAQIVRYASQQVFLRTPARAVYITSVVNTSSQS